MDISLGLAIVFALLAALAGFAAAWALASSRAAARVLAAERRATEAREALVGAHAQNTQLTGDNERLVDRAMSDGKVLTALGPILTQLEQVSNRVVTLQTRQESHHSQMMESLREEARVQAELASTTQSLNAALRSTSARGTWGEVQLERIIEASGMARHVDFELQRSSAKNSVADGGKRPDATIILPGAGRIAIDAKVPMSAYLEAHEISTDDLASAADRHKLLADHAKAIRAHVRELERRNYPADFPGSPQLTVMFLPAESILASALDSEPALLDFAARKGIVLATPASLLAILRSVAAVWSSATATEDAQHIVRLGTELVRRLETFVTHLDKLGSALTSSVRNYNSAVASLESRVLVTARTLDTLTPTDSPLRPRTIDPDQAQVRTITALGGEEDIASHN